MTDEKKPSDLDAGGAETGSQAPDESRRRLAKAALTIPLLMTLAPRSVLAQSPQKFCPNDNLLSIALVSAEPIGAALTSLAARTGTTELEILDCYDCVADPPGDVKNCVKK